MKKIFSLVLTLALVSSAFAAPMKQGAKFISDKQQLDVQLPEVKFERLPLQNPSPVRFMAPAMTEGAVAFTDAQAILYNGAWYLDLYNGDDYVAEFGFVGPSETEIAGTYTADGTNAVASVVAAAGDTVTTTGSFTIAYKGKGTQYSIYTITANLTDESGRTFTFSGDAEVMAMDYMALMYCQLAGMYCDEIVIDLDDAPFVPSGDTIQVAFTQNPTLDFYAASSTYPASWQMYAENGAYVLSFAADGEESNLIGTYTQAELDMTYTYFYLGETEIKIKNVDLVISAGASAGAYNFDGYLTCKDGNVYHVTVSYEVPTAKQTLNLTIAAQYQDYTAEEDPFFFVSGATADSAYVVSLYISGSSLNGTYTKDDTYYKYTYIYDKTNNLYIDIFSATINSSVANGILTVNADLLGQNSTLFKVVMTAEAYDTALENVNINDMPEKVIIDGQLIIIRDGKAFNVQGIEL